MNLSFWRQVQQNWQSLQLDAAEDVINLELFRNILKNDIGSAKEKVSIVETTPELLNDDDFWGGL